MNKEQYANKIQRLVSSKSTILANMLNLHKEHLYRVVEEMSVCGHCMVDGVVYYIVDGKDYTTLPHTDEKTPYILKINEVDQYDKTTSELVRTLQRIVDPTNEYISRVTIHAFKSIGPAVSFDQHVDPTDVFLFMLDGAEDKEFEIEDRLYDFKEKPYLHVPSYVPHKGINNNSNLMLSIGFEHFLSKRMVY